MNYYSDTNDKNNTPSFIETVLKSSDCNPTTSVVQKLPEKNAVHDILTEDDFQVKIADLGNACWTVSVYILIVKLIIINLLII